MEPFKYRKSDHSNTIVFRPLFGTSESRVKYVGKYRYVCRVFFLVFIFITNSPTFSMCSKCSVDIDHRFAIGAHTSYFQVGEFLMNSYCRSSYLPKLVCYKSLWHKNLWNKAFLNWITIFCIVTISAVLWQKKQLTEANLKLIVTILVIWSSRRQISFVAFTFERGWS